MVITSYCPERTQVGATSKALSVALSMIIIYVYTVQKRIMLHGKSHGLLSGKNDDLRVGERARIPVGVEAVNVTTLEYKACAANP